MQKIRKILGAVSEKNALPTNQPTNQPIITNNTDVIGPLWCRSKKTLNQFFWKIPTDWYILCNHIKKWALKMVCLQINQTNSLAGMYIDREVSTQLYRCLRHGLYFFTKMVQIFWPSKIKQMNYFVLLF